MMVSTRPRLNTAQLQRRNVNDNEGTSFMLKTARQVFVSLIVVILVFTISKVNNSVCKGLIVSIENTLVYTVDYKRAASDIMEVIKKIPTLLGRESQDNPPAEDGGAESAEAAAVEGNGTAEGTDTGDENADVNTN